MKDFSFQNPTRIHFGRDALRHLPDEVNRYGKHVVLDQNPALEHLFTPDGWAWNIASAPVLDLLKQVRAELYDLFGEGQFMHIGCDEAFDICKCPRCRDKQPHLLFAEHIGKLRDHLAARGAETMMWGDRLLKAKECNYNGYRASERHVLKPERRLYHGSG